VQDNRGVPEVPDAPGLTEAEAAKRLAARGPVAPPATSRSLASIVRANVFTVFNAILVSFGALMLVFGDWRDALFLGIVVANSGIGIAQELRAKRALDRLYAEVAPHATVVRDGEPRRVRVEEVVPGDLVHVEAGDGIVADGTLERSDGLALDESILTGESRAVVRAAGEEVRSGSYAVEGAGSYVVTAVGDASYAQRLAGEAREFRHPRSPLERSLNRLLLVMVAFMVPVGTVFLYALWQREVGIREAVTTATAGIVTLVPEGLILLASLTFAAAALQMARRGALAQQLNATESLASVDTVCLDKTGTLTSAELEVVGLEPAFGVSDEELADALGRFAASSPARNRTLEAVAAAHPAEAAEPQAYVPFSSARRWSGLALDGDTYILGAPERLGLDPRLASAAAREQEAGRRVVAFAQTRETLEDADGSPPANEPLGLVVLSERLRPDARETVAFLRDEGVELRVLSGDAPATVAAIARDAGIDVDGGAADGSRTDDLPPDAHVVGRISPEGKRRLVERLAAEGRYVAMIGDGVNDVPALKAARLAIAQGSGSEMARSVADVVLVRGDFAALPGMVGEGRKILRNVQRVAKLFVTKSAFAAFLILAVGLSETPYPLLPRHLSLAATLTVGIPGFFLALAPSDGPWRTAGFLREVARFAIPAGTAAGLGVLAAYLFALNVAALGVLESRTVALSALVVVGLWFVVVLEASTSRRAMAVGTLCVALLGLYVVVLVLPGLRDFFALSTLGPWGVLGVLGGVALTVGGLALSDERFVPAEIRRRLRP
jgi:magnesium-transporting ATPase (P-type)